MHSTIKIFEATLWSSRNGLPHPLVWHEAAHALVGYRLGMRVEHVDMTGAHAPCPSCGLDEQSVPAERRARVIGLAALAGPVAEQLADGAPPRWREDGQVAREAARSLATGAAEQTELVLEWRREARRMLEADPAYVPLVQRLAQCERLTGEEFEAFMREVEPMKYPLSQHEGYLLITVDGRRYLLDTGSPWSLGIGTVRLAGREFTLRATDPLGQSWGSLVEMVGTPLDGLIGMDVLAEFDLEISLPTQTVTLSRESLDLSGGLAVQSVEGVPLIECVAAGKPVRVFFDTGAPLSYVSDAYTDAAPALGEVEDFHPLLGRFTAPTFAVPMTVGASTGTVRCGSLPMLLQTALGLAGADGILGTEVLNHGLVRFSSRQGLLRLDVNS